MDGSTWLARARSAAHSAVQRLAAESTDLGLRGPLRGVRSIPPDKLRRASVCDVTPYETGFRVECPASEDGGVHWVNLDDPQMDRCDCADYVNRSEKTGEPCKHILAALVHRHDPQLRPFLEDLVRRDTLAAAIQKPVEQ